MIKSKKHQFSINLAQYVKRRNGVPLGAAGSMSNMLSRSFGAGYFAEFWRYWNPIWGYYLSCKVFTPAKHYLPTELALLLTFLVSGIMHDLATMVVRGAPAFLFTPWFVLMALSIIVSDVLGIRYRQFNWLVRAAINTSYIGISLYLTVIFRWHFDLP